MNIPAWRNEKEILGFFITGHPLEKYRDKLEDLHALSTEEIAAMKSSTGKDENIITAGIITSIRVLKSKTWRFLRAGGARRHVWLAGDAGFPRGISQTAGQSEARSAGVDTGRRKNRRRRESQTDGQRDQPLEEAKVPLPRSLRVRIPLETSNAATVDALHALFSRRKGEAKVLFDVERQGDFMVVMEAEGYNVEPDRNFVACVEELCGRGAVRVID